MLAESMAGSYVQHDDEVQLQAGLHLLQHLVFR